MLKSKKNKTHAKRIKSELYKTDGPDGLCSLHDAFQIFIAPRKSRWIYWCLRFLHAFYIELFCMWIFGYRGSGWRRAAPLFWPIRGTWVCRSSIPSWNIWNSVQNVLYISQSPGIQVLSRYFQVSCFEVRNSYHNPISVPQGLWCSALVAHLHPHWRSNAMFHVTWCLSETSQLSRQQ